MSRNEEGKEKEEKGPEGESRASPFRRSSVKPALTNQPESTSVWYSVWML